MHKPCQCLPWSEEAISSIQKSITSKYFTRVEVRSIFSTEKAHQIHLTKQTLPNGVEIPTGYKVWIPDYLCLKIDRILKYAVISNKKLNEIIRSINIKKIKDER